MDNSKKYEDNFGCIKIVLIIVICWGLNGLIWGNGFIEGIEENIIALFSLGMLGLSLYGFYKLFLEKDKND